MNTWRKRKESHILMTINDNQLTKEFSPINDSVTINEGERIDDLMRNGYGIIQHPGRFCFGMDAVLLSSFSKVKKGEKTIDLGTGTGIIPILLEAKTKGNHFVGIDIQEASVEMARRSVELNNLTHKIDIVHADIKEAVTVFGKASFDVVTSNPPYMNSGHGITNPNEPKAIARHELLCSLADVVSQAAGLLRENGRFYMVHRPTRLAEIFGCMYEHRLEPKRMCLVYPYVNREPNMVLIEAIKGAGKELRVDKPLIVYNENGTYTDELLKMY